MSRRKWELVLPDPVSAERAAKSLKDSGVPIDHDENGALVRDPWNITVRLNGLRPV